MKQVCFDIPDVPEYRQAFWGRVWELGKEYVWEREDPEDENARIAAQYWRNVLWTTYQRYLADENCDADDCRSYSPGAPFIQWFPNDPYNTPALVPAGYNNPPWYLATTASNLALGSSTGDVITSIDRFPPGSLPTIIPSSGLPRFRVNVSGAGVITLHLVNLVAGSLLQLTKDDDIFSIKFIDVNRDLVSLPPETMDAFQVQVEFTTPGLHWVDCIIVSWVNASIPFLHHGGGLRQVDLCGFTTMPLVPPTMIRSDPSGCGNLEKSTDGGTTWTDIDNTDFLRRDGVCAMTGGLEIYPADHVESLIVRQSDSAVSHDVVKIQRQDGLSLIRIFRDGEIGADTTIGGFDKFSIYGGNYSVKYGTLTRSSILGVTDAGFTLMGKATLRPFQMLAFDSVTSTVYCTGKGGTVKNQVWRKSNVIDYDNAWIGADGDGHFGIRNAASDIPDGVTLDHESTAAGGAGLGIALKMQGKSSTTSAQAMARLYAAWETATHATRVAKVVLAVSDFSGEKTLIEGGVTGASTPKLGFLGASPQPRLALSGDCEGNPVVKSIAQLLALFGFATDATTLGSHPALTPFDVTGDKFGNEALASLITGLDTANIINDLTSDTGAYEYEPPAPIEVEGSWQGLEVGKALALSLAGNDYIVDSTELGAVPEPNVSFLNLRCRAAAAANVIVHHWYNYLAYQIAYAPLILDVGSRWEQARTLAAFNMDQQQDIYNDWAVQVHDAFYNGLNTDDVEAHMADMINYIPDIQQAFYCGIGDDGILTASGLITIQTALAFDDHTGGVPDNINTWFYDFFKYLDAGELALAIAHALNSTYVADVDCEAMLSCGDDDPDWCKQYNFTLGSYTPPFEDVSGDHVFGATFNPGWKTDDTGILRIEFPFPTIEVTIKYNVTSPDDAYIVEFGTLDGMFTDNLSVDGGTYEETIVIPEPYRAGGWYFRAACNPVNCVVTFKGVTNMQGTGIEPTDLNDC